MLVAGQRLWLPPEARNARPTGGMRHTRTAPPLTICSARVTGQPSRAACRSSTSSASGLAWRLMTTGRPGRMIPALASAMVRMLPPNASTCSIPGARKGQCMGVWGVAGRGPQPASRRRQWCIMGASMHACTCVGTQGDPAGKWMCVAAGPFLTRHQYCGACTGTGAVGRMQNGINA